MNSRWLGLPRWTAATLCAGWVIASCGMTTPLVTPRHAGPPHLSATKERASGTVTVFDREQLELRTPSGTTTAWALPWGTHVYEAKSATTSALASGHCIDLLATAGNAGAEALVAGSPVVFPSSGSACGSTLPPGALLRGARSLYGSLAGITTYEGEITKVSGEDVTVRTAGGHDLLIDIPASTSLTAIIEVPRSSIVLGACVRAAVSPQDSHSLSAITIVPAVPTCTGVPSPSMLPAVGSTPTPSPSLAAGGAGT